jgi:hypothetical protein
MYIQDFSTKPIYIAIGSHSAKVCLPCLMLKFTEVQNILDVLMKYEILEFCRFGFNQRKFLRTKTLDILPENQISPECR